MITEVGLWIATPAEEGFGAIEHRFGHRAFRTQNEKGRDGT